MASVKPFCGFLYDPRKAGDVGRLTAPPYDVLYGPDLEKLRAKSAFNVVRVDLPEQSDLPGAKDKYDAAAKIFSGWRAQGIVRQDEMPAYYRYRQEFVPPGGNKRLCREGLLAAVRLHPFSEKVILPHEKTLDGPKVDRLNLTQATRMNLSPTFSFYFDPAGEVRKTLGGPTGEPFCDFTDEAGVRQRLWRVTDPSICAALEEIFQKLPLFIADGHHRYTTMINYRDQARERLGKIDPGHPAEATLMYVADASEMTVLPYHRILLASAGLGARKRAPRVLQHLSAHFSDTRLATKTQEERAAFMEKLFASKAAYAFGIVGPDHAHLLESKDPAALQEAFDQGVPEANRGLDIAALHDFVFARELGITAEKIAQGGLFKFSPDFGVVFDLVASNEADLGFLVRPTRVEQVREVALAGEVMPQKSTYFYPKLLSGLVFRSLEP